MDQAAKALDADTVGKVAPAIAQRHPIPQPSFTKGSL